MTTLVENNTLDYGLTEDNLSVQIVSETDIKHKFIVNETDILNPFFVTTAGGNLKDTDVLSIYSAHKRVIVICLTNSYDNNLDGNDLKQIYSPVISKDNYKKLGKCLTLINASRKLLKNTSHFKQAMYVNKSYLHDFNHNKIEFTDEEIVISLFDLKEESANKYLNLYENPYDLSHLLDTMVLYKYYNCETYKHPILKHISNISNNIKESDFWTNPIYCSMNGTDEFVDRSFKAKSVNSEKIKATVLSKTKQQSTDVGAKKQNSGSDFYLQNMYKNRGHVDGASALGKSKRTYYATDIKKLPITKDQITDLFVSINTEKELYDMFNTLLLIKLM